MGRVREDLGLLTCPECGCFVPGSLFPGLGDAAGVPRGLPATQELEETLLCRAAPLLVQSKGWKRALGSQISACFPIEALPLLLTTAYNHSITAWLGWKEH